MAIELDELIVSLLGRWQGHFIHSYVMSRRVYPNCFIPTAKYANNRFERIGGTVAYVSDLQWRSIPWWNGLSYPSLPMSTHHLWVMCDGFEGQRTNQQPLLCLWCHLEFALPEFGKLSAFRYASQLTDRLKSCTGKAKTLKKKSQVCISQYKRPRSSFQENI